MDEVSKKVFAARRRVLFNQFLKTAVWTLLFVLAVIATGIAIPKLWHLSFLDSPGAANFWIAGWTVGGSVIGLLLAAGLTFAKRASLLNVAVEVDQRFGLKSRLSSALAMSADDQNTLAGEALADDAAKQAQLIDVRDEFKVETTWHLGLPVLAAFIVVGLLFVPNASNTVAAVKKTDIKKDKEEEQRVQTAVENLKKKMREKRVTSGLKDAELNFEKFEREIGSIEKEDDKSKKQTLIKLNDLKKQLADKQDKIGTTKGFKEALNKLKSLGKSPAKELADAMKRADMKAAKKAIENLAKRLKDGDLNDREMKRLKKDLEDMAKQMKDLADAQKQKKEELEKQIQKAKAEGDLDKAAQLQEKLDQVKKQNNQAKKMKEMAKKLGECAKCMGGNKPGKAGKPGGKPNGKPGNPSDNEQNSKAEGAPSPDAESKMRDAAQQMEDLAKQIEEMQNELEDLENLEDMQDAIDQAKAEMNDCECEGDGDKPGGQGMGKGRGVGRRPKEESNTGNFKSRVRGKLQKGQIVITGTADGENLTGRTMTEAREIINAEMSSQKAAVENQLLPKSQRDHTRQYFQSLLNGQTKQ